MELHHPISHHLKVCSLGQSVPHLPSCVLVTVGFWTVTRPALPAAYQMFVRSVEWQHTLQLSKPSNATYSARPVGQPGCGRRLPQPGQMTIGEELLGYHNNKIKMYFLKILRCTQCIRLFDNLLYEFIIYFTYFLMQQQRWLTLIEVMTPRANLPEDKSECVDIDFCQRHKTVVQIDGAFQHLRSHVSQCTNLTKHPHMHRQPTFKNPPT